MEDKNEVDQSLEDEVQSESESEDDEEDQAELGKTVALWRSWQTESGTYYQRATCMRTK